MILSLQPGKPPGPGNIHRVFEKIEIEEISPYGGEMSRLSYGLYPGEFPGR